MKYGNQRDIEVKKRRNIGNSSRSWRSEHARFRLSFRSESGPESDVDFLIELEPGRTLLDHAALYLELKKLLGREVDVVNEKGLRPGIRDRVLGEAVPI